MAEYCRSRILDMGLELYPAESAVCSPTVTAIRVPGYVTWKQLDESLRTRGMVVGGNYGCLAGKVFRIGHMGAQANLGLLEKAMDILQEVLRERNKEN